MRKSAKVMIVGAVVFVGSFVLGVGGTMIGIIGSFDAVEESGTGSLEGLAEGIANSLISTAVAMPVAFIGLSLFIGGLVAYFIGKWKSRGEEQSA